MSIVLAAATAALMVQPTCSWDRPGVDRYRGSAATAVEHYRDIPAADRAVLARRIAAGDADDRVQITRTAIAGANQYDSRISDMHFGAARLCRTVTRTKWPAARSEPAAVYCVNDECLLVPQVCGNVSRVRRIITAGPGGGGSTGGATPLPQPPTAGAPFPQPVPVYSTVPSGGEDLPPWARHGEPIAPPPLPDYPGPGRDYTGPGPGGPGAIAPVPEPSTWAMLAAGVALVAARLRRGRKATVAAAPAE